MLQSLWENLCAKRSCSVGLQADTVDSSTCPPEGGRYTDQNQVLTQTLQACLGGEKASHKSALWVAAS